MSTLNVSKRFPVHAPPERVWRYLVRPSLVVSCLPGAALEASLVAGRAPQLPGRVRTLPASQLAVTVFPESYCHRLFPPGLRVEGSKCRGWDSNPDGIAPRGF